VLCLCITQLRVLEYRRRILRACHRKG